ncbi:MAG: hypothetical protein Fur005_21380 [Roseiflexaceae bacterium]
MTIDFDSLDYIAQLRKAGTRPSEKLVQRILKLGDRAIAPLLQLATDDMLLAGEHHVAPIHALRLLGELKSTTIIEPLLDSFPMDDGIEQREQGEPAAPPELWDQELPQILGSLGEAAIEPLWAYADNPEKDVSGRSTALTALAYVTAVVPEQRAAIVAGLRERIANAANPADAAYALIALGNIGVAEAYSEVMALYKAEKIDREIISPGVARQLLLSKGEKRLACAKHPLWERYDQHGPFSDYR